MRFCISVYIVILLQLLSVVSVLRAAEIGLSNPGFEIDSDSDNVPDGWFRLRRAIYDTAAHNARSGTAAARVNVYHFYGQELPVTGGAHYTFSSWSRGEAGLDFGALDAEWWRDGEKVGITRGASFLVTQEYTEQLASFLVPEEANFVRFYPRSSWGFSWIWVDDCHGWSEYIENGGFESATESIPDSWYMNGTPLVDCTGTRSRSGSCAARVDNSNFLYQPLAVTFEGKKYIISFWSRAPSPVPVSFTLDWYDWNGLYISSTALDFFPDTQWDEYAFEIIPPGDAVLGELVLQPETAGEVWVDDVDIAWHTATPHHFSPNADEIYDTATITYSVSRPSSVTLVIETPGGTPINTLESSVQKNRTVTHIPWDGTNPVGSVVPDGVYRYNIIIENAFSPHLILSGDIELDTVREYAVPENPFNNFFPRGVWIFAAGTFEDVDYGALFADLSDHNLNAALLDRIPEYRYTDALNAGESHGIKTILYNQAMNILIENNTGYSPLEESVVRDEAQRLFSSYGSFDSLLGYYIIDEPATGLKDNVLLVNSVLGDIDPEHPGFSSIGNVPDYATLIEDIRPAVYLHHFYPLPVRSRAQPDDFNAFIQNLETLSGMAYSHGRPLWMIVQGYSRTTLSGLITPEEMRCEAYLCIAHGVKGLFFFMYYSSGTIIGLRDYTLESTERLQALGDLMADIEKLESLFLEWEHAPPVATSSLESCVIKTLEDGAGNRYLVVVNTDCVNPAYPVVTLQESGLGGIRDVRDEIPLAFKTSGGQTLLDLEILPGDGRILKIE